MMTGSRRVLGAALVALAALPMLAAGGAAASESDTTRIAGPNRFSTSVAVSKYFSAHTGTDLPLYFLASGENFPDGLSAGAAAGAVSGHLLLVPKDGTLPADVSAELKRQKGTQAIIAGGTGAVSSRMEAQIRQVAEGTTRVEGSDRFDTAAIFGTGVAGDTVFLAAGGDFPDALAGGAAAGGLKAALLLTGPKALPGPTVDVLNQNKPAKVVVLGGAGAVRDDVVRQVRWLLPQASVTRVSGVNRYATAAAISRYAFPSGAPSVYLASGEAFPDALAANASAGGQRKPLLLTTKDCVPQATLAEIKRLRATKFVVVGGTGVLSTNVIDRVACSF